jgi:hypothetical protein
MFNEIRNSISSLEYILKLRYAWLDLKFWMIGWSPYICGCNQSEVTFLIADFPIVEPVNRMSLKWIGFNKQKIICERKSIMTTQNNNTNARHQSSVNELNCICASLCDASASIFQSWICCTKQLGCNMVVSGTWSKFSIKGFFLKLTLGQVEYDQE